MKNISKTITSKKLFYAIIALAGVTLASSCKKDDGYDFEGTVSAKVQLVNASPGADAAKLYVADVLRTPNTVAYGSASGYNLCYAGQADVDVKSGDGTVLATTNTEIDAANSYTYFLSGAPGSQSVIVVHDDTEAASSGKAKVRFVQAASGYNTVDLAANGITLFSEQNYKTSSNTAEVAAGAYIFTVANAGSSAALATSASVNFEAGKNYTVYTRGMSGGTGASALAIGVLTVN